MEERSFVAVVGLFLLFGPVLNPLISAVLALPGWAVVGVPGLLLAWAGRSRRERQFVRQDQF